MLEASVLFADLLVFSNVPCFGVQFQKNVSKSAEKGTHYSLKASHCHNIDVWILHHQDVRAVSTARSPHPKIKTFSLASPVCIV